MPRKQTLRRIGKMMVYVFAGLTMLFVIVAAIVGFEFSHWNLNFGREHLKAIPIAASACPYVAVMHAAANEVQSNEPIPALILTPGTGPVQTSLAWPHSRRRFDAALGTMERAIVASRPHVPARVGGYLDVTLADIRTGRTLLKTDGSREHETDSAMVTRYQNLLTDGQQAFGYAGDLIGTQCGVQLSADSSTMSTVPFEVINASSTTRPAAPRDTRPKT